jgi:signal transduction histidine kinase
MTRTHDPLLQAITRAQRSYQVGGSTGPLFDRMLSDLLALTDSAYGFIGEVLRNDDGVPYLKTHAITNIAWNDDTRRFYEDNAPNGLEFYNLKSLFGAVLSTEEPVIANTPATDPRRCGIPEGHPSLDAFLGAPFFHGGRFVGMVGIANRPGGYDEALLDWLQPLLTTCAGIISVHRAWLDQLEAERSLREAKDAAERASAAKDRFLANMSHELRTPLNAIIGFTGVVLKATPPEERAHKMLTRVRANGEHLLSLVEDILDVARIEQGDWELTLEEVALGALARDLVDDLAPRAKPGVRLLVEPGGPELVWSSDRRALRQVLTNLVVNSLKFTDEGSVVVRLRAEGPDEWLEVADTGIGIAPDQLARIFEPFHQVDASSTRSTDGAGLGLALVRRLADSLGLLVEAHSDLGAGSVFRVRPRAAHATDQ